MNAIIYIYWKDQSGLRYGYRPCPILAANKAGHDLLDGAKEYQDCGDLNLFDQPDEPGLWRLDVELDPTEDDIIDTHWHRMTETEVSALADGSLCRRVKAGEFDTTGEEP